MMRRRGFADLLNPSLHAAKPGTVLSAVVCTISMGLTRIALCYDRTLSKNIACQKLQYDSWV